MLSTKKFSTINLEIAITGKAVRSINLVIELIWTFNWVIQPIILLNQYRKRCSHERFQIWNSMTVNLWLLTYWYDVKRKQGRIYFQNTMMLKYLVIFLLASIINNALRRLLIQKLSFPRESARFSRESESFRARSLGESSPHFFRTEIHEVKTLQTAWSSSSLVFHFTISKRVWSTNPANFAFDKNWNALNAHESVCLHSKPTHTHSKHYQNTLRYSIPPKKAENFSKLGLKEFSFDNVSSSPKSLF